MGVHAARLLLYVQKGVSTPHRDAENRYENNGNILNAMRGERLSNENVRTRESIFRGFASNQTCAKLFIYPKCQSAYRKINDL